MTTLEEMVETFIDGDGLQDARSGLTAVLERHVRGMIARAHEDGVRAGRGDVMLSNHNDYADRIITQLKGQRE